MINEWIDSLYNDDDNVKTKIDYVNAKIYLYNGIMFNAFVPNKINVENDDFIKAYKTNNKGCVASLKNPIYLKYSDIVMIDFDFHHNFSKYDNALSGYVEIEFDESFNAE